MANIITELAKEISRVRSILPKLDPQRRRDAELTVGFADVHMTMNSLEGMMESLTDLKEFKVEPRRAVAP